VASHGVTVATLVWFKEKLEEGFLSFFVFFVIFLTLNIGQDDGE
jgi:hypothetical protein